MVVILTPFHLLSRSIGKLFKMKTRQDNDYNEDNDGNDRAFLVGLLGGNVNLQRMPSNRELLSALLHRNRNGKQPIKFAALKIFQEISAAFNVPRWKIKTHLIELHGAWRGIDYNLL